MNLTPFEEHKDALRAAYVCNECDTDEYGETQPAKGLRHIAWAMEMADDATTRDELVSLTAKWLTAIEAGGFARYAGADELAAILPLVFDMYWLAGETPYYSDPTELQEYLTTVVLDEEDA